MSEINGKVIAVLPIATGEGKNGTWKSQDYVLETGGQYPKKVCFNLLGDKIDQFPIAIDEEIKVSYDIESREYNGRWFTTIRAWKVDKEAVGGSQASVANDVPTAPAGDDLPF